MVLIEKHAKLSNSKIAVNVINTNNKDYIQEVLGLRELNEFMDVLGAKEVKVAEKGVYLPHSEHNQFYQQLNL